MDQAALLAAHNEAISLYREGRLDPAIEILESLLEQKFAASGRALFAIYSKLGRLQESIAVGVKAALADPAELPFVGAVFQIVLQHAKAANLTYSTLTTQPRSWSVIVCSHRDEAYDEFVRRLLVMRGDHEVEIVRIRDAKTMSEGYERGLARARHDNIILCHHDIEFLLPDALNWLDLALQHFDGVGVAGGTRLNGSMASYDIGRLVQTQETGEGIVSFSPFAGVREASVLDGALMVFHRQVLERLGFDAAIPGFHYYDVDLCFRARQQGYRLGIVPQAALFHQSHGCIDEAWHQAKAYFERKHKIHNLGSTKQVLGNPYFYEPLKREQVGPVWRYLNELAARFDAQAYDITSTRA